MFRQTGSHARSITTVLALLVLAVGSTDGYMYAFEAATGDVLWQTPHDGGTSTKNPILANGVVYVGSLGDSVYAFDAMTGETLWSNLAGESPSEVIVTDGTLYAGSNSDSLYAFRLPGASSP
ncbi:hypothetical protein BH20ACT24_BH20ACT24_08840 [soil metagenome]